MSCLIFQFIRYVDNIRDFLDMIISLLVYLPLGFKQLLCKADTNIERDIKNGRMVFSILFYFLHFRSSFF